MEYYFDNSATTMVCREAAEKALYMMQTCYGNPSSLHSLGFSAEKEMDSAREILAGKLSCQPKELFFTSGGTESNNIAILGGAKAKSRLGKKIVTTAMEHPSVLEPMKQLEKEGFQVVYLKPDSHGEIDPALLYEAITKDTILVSMMSVNNETGAVQPLKDAAAAIKRAGSPALFHVDHVQGFGKLPLSPAKLGIDLMSISGHKIHAPKGVGALYLNAKARVLPRTFGGGQERAIRPGTEPVPAICAMGAAAQALPDEKKELEAISALNTALKEELLKIPEITINSPEQALPYILNFSCGKVRAETMLHFLESKNIYVSTGSACSKAKPSHVLSAMDLPRERIESSIRVSFSRFNTPDQIPVLVSALREGLSTLAHFK